MKKVLGALALVCMAVAAVFAFPALAVPLVMPPDLLASKLSDGLPMVAFGGLLVNKDSLSSLFTGLKTLFHDALKATPNNWQLTAMEVPSTSSGEDYAWLSRFPKMRKWVGEKFIKVLEAGKYYKKNEDWETTIEVDRNDMEDDRLGIYNMQSKSAGESAGELNDLIVMDLKNGAFTNTCMDGQYFYDTDHPLKNSDGVTTSVSNKGTAALSAADAASAAASLGAAIKAVMSFTDSEGMPLNLVPDVLEVPPALLETGKILCDSPKLQNDTPNPYHNVLKLVVNPMLTSSTAWFVHVTKKQAMKPFIVQMRKRPVFVSQTDMNADDVFLKRKFKFGAEARATGVYGFWQLSYGSTGA